MSADFQSASRLPDLLSLQAAAQPEGTALWWRGEAISYRTLNDRVARLASRIASTGFPGDRVAVLAWNCPEFIELIYAVPASGRILVPLNARLAPPELIYQLVSAGASTLFADSGLLQPLLHHPALPEDLSVITLEGDYSDWRDDGPSVALPETSEVDPVWILYTSGSTGRPKGAVLTHRSFMAGLRSAALGRPVLPGDRYLYPFPLFHVAAHNVLLQHQYGAAVALTRSFDPKETLDVCRDLRISTLSLAPTMIAMLLDHAEYRPDDLAAVRTIGYGASAMPESLLRRLLSETGIGLCQSYGMTELSGSVAFLTVEDHRRALAGRPGLLRSVGRPLPTVEVRLVDDAGGACPVGVSGEVLVRGEQCMSGYWQQPAATAEALAGGWLHTGDIGRFDDEGYLYIVDRKKDMIVSGGENIASKEVEEVLRGHPAVKDCAVVGLPDAKWGETVCAVVQLCGQASDLELLNHCRVQLAGYKTPRRLIRVDALPLNAAGKIDKPRLRKDYSSEQ